MRLAVGGVFGAVPISERGTNNETHYPGSLLLGVGCTVIGMATRNHSTVPIARIAARLEVREARVWM